MLGDIYESRACPEYRRSAAYFEVAASNRNAKTHFDARICSRPAITDKQLNERQKAIELYC